MTLNEFFGQSVKYILRYFIFFLDVVCCSFVFQLAIISCVHVLMSNILSRQMYETAVHSLACFHAISKCHQQTVIKSNEWHLVSMCFLLVCIHRDDESSTGASVNDH